MWTYKDIGTMGTLMARPDSPFVLRISGILEKKNLLNSHFGVRWLPENTSMKKLVELADFIRELAGYDFVDLEANRKYMEQAVFSVYAAVLLQKPYANCFKYLSTEELDSLLSSSFAARNCNVNQGLVEVIKRRIRD
jgi:hypothetical protein